MQFIARNVAKKELHSTSATVARNVARTEKLHLVPGASTDDSKKVTLIIIFSIEHFSIECR